METETIELKYEVWSSGYKDYIKVMLGDTEIFYLKTDEQGFDFKQQEIQHMVDALNIVHVLYGALTSVVGVEAWITPKERHLMSKIYPAIDLFRKTHLGKYTRA